MPTREDFEMALALARQAFSELDPRDQAEKAGVQWLSAGTSGSAEVRFLGIHYVIEGPEGEVRYREASGKEPALWEKILILHYFNRANGSLPSVDHISFKEIRDGMLYLPTFEKRAVHPLLGRFGRRPAEILEPVQALGGREEALGDFSVTVPVFPRVPITLVFWEGDEEFPARLTILFDRTVTGYLPTEDIVLSSQMMAFRLIGLAGR